MSKKVTITVSDSLHQRLQAVRDEFNISAVCQPAIERAVELQEYKIQIQDSQEKYKLKLKKEKEMRLIASVEEAKEHAFQEGFNAPEMSDFTYEDFLEFEEGDLPEWFDDWFPRYIDRYTFVEGILAYWKTVKDKI